MDFWKEFLTDWVPWTALAILGMFLTIAYLAIH